MCSDCLLKRRISKEYLLVCKTQWTLARVITFTVNSQWQNYMNFICSKLSYKGDYLHTCPLRFANQWMPENIPSLSSQSEHMKSDIYWFGMFWLYIQQAHIFTVVFLSSNFFNVTGVPFGFLGGEGVTPSWTKFTSGETVYKYFCPY